MRLPLLLCCSSLLACTVSAQTTASPQSSAAPQSGSLVARQAAPQSSAAPVIGHAPEGSVDAALIKKLQAKIRVMLAEQSSCPVSVEARHEAGSSQFLATGTGVRMAPQGHGLAVSFGPHAGVAVVGARVRVWGYSPHARVMEAGDGIEHNAGPDVSRVFELQLADPEDSAKVWMRGVSALTRVDVEEIRYADGSAWRPDGDKPCSVVPSAVLEVAATQ